MDPGKEKRKNGGLTPGDAEGSEVRSEAVEPEESGAANRVVGGDADEGARVEEKQEESGDECEEEENEAESDGAHSGKVVSDSPGG